MATIAAIKIMQKQAGLTDPEYRNILRRVAGVTSCKLCTPEQRRQVLAEIRKKIHRPAAEKTPAERKIWALWYELRRSLPEVERSYAYLIGMATKANGGDGHCAITRLDQLSARQSQRLIEALKQRIATERITGGEANYKLKS